MTSRALSRIGLVGVIGLLAACSTAAESPSQAIPEATPVPIPSTEPAPGPPEPEGTLPVCPAGELCTGVLEPGEYTTDAVGDTTLTLTVEEPWEAENLPEAGAMALYPLDGSPSDVAAFRFTGQVFADPCDIETTESVDETPEAMIEWLTAHPDLQVGEPEEATLGDATGLRVEITAVKEQLCPENQPVPPDWILLWELPAVGDFHFNDGEGAIVYALHVGEELVIVVAESVDDPEAFLPVAQAVIDSMEFASD